MTFSLNILDTLPFNPVLVSMVRQSRGQVHPWHPCSVLYLCYGNFISLGFLGKFEMLCDYYKMRTAKNWILMARTQAAKGASSSVNQRKSILRKGGGKSIKVRQKHPEPSRKKVGANRNLQVRI